MGDFSWGARMLGCSSANDDYFNVMQEPSKADIVAFNNGGPKPPRRAALVLQAPPSNYVAEVVVDFAGPAVESWEQVHLLGLLKSVVALLFVKQQ